MVKLSIVTHTFMFQEGDVRQFLSVFVQYGLSTSKTVTL